jgi:membrane protease YdiL (CAAX protease family)
MKNGIDLEALSKTEAYFSDTDKNVILFAMLFVFAVLLLSAVFLIKLIHRRSWQEVINGTNRVRWSRFFFGFSISGLISIVLFVVSYFSDSGSFVFYFEPVNFFILMIIAVIFIPLQATAEEFAFRGYIAQGVASWTKSRWWAFIIPTVLFALLHSANPEIKEYGFGVMMAQYLFMGLMLGIMSILDDGIELVQDDGHGERRNG